MDWGGPEFVLAIIAISTIGWVFTTWIRARHGYPVTDDWGKTIDKDGATAERRFDLLTDQNVRANDQIARLEERIAVLERIATDRSGRLADQIEALR